MALLESSIVFIALVIGTFTDIKVREVPDWLNFSLIGAGFGIAVISSIVSFSYFPIISSLTGFGLAFVISILMFYSGQWGGGDAKMLMGIGAIIGASFSLNDFFVAFVFNLTLAGAVYGLLWGFGLGFIHRKNLGEEMIKLLTKTKIAKARKYVVLTTVVLVLIVIISPFGDLKIPLLALVFLLFSTFYLWIYVKAIEKVCMIKKISPKKLTDGDWIIEDVKIGKKVISKKADLGVSKEQIAELIKKNVKSVTIKTGLPFIPSFLLAYIFTYFYGNLFLLFLT
ncbi:prepilin peptidase [Candidatus Woesearchaeota archaeon]|nr:prepilin peptidase [Candidatus Woesearchaeota archaeon]